MIRYKFSKDLNKEFSAELKKRVTAYFKDNGINRSGNPEMTGKALFAFTVYITSYLVMLLGGFTSIPLLFLLWTLVSMGYVFLGTSVMHDALHGTYSKRRSVNNLMGATAMLIGIDSSIWKIQHNVFHHTYTNIEHADEDINPRYFLRFSPNQPRRWFHHYQHIYAVFFYGVTTLMWATIKDFVKVYDYRKREVIKKGREFRVQLGGMIIRKVLYHIVFLVLPIIFLDVSPWIVVLMFIYMHFVTGVLLSLIFQTAHVMPSSEFLMQDEPKVEQNWQVHQISTTSNYAMKNKLFAWLFGGLNFQVEHHLFPDICHIHYPHISKLVKQTATEYDLPYHAEKSFGSAIVNHFRLLRKLGRQDDI